MENSQNKTNFRFMGRERYYVIAGRQLDRETNNGSDGYISRQSLSLKITIAKILVIVFLCTLINLIIWSGYPSGIPDRISGEKQSLSIRDDAGILDNTDELQKTIDEYYDLAGISAVICTVYDEDWKGTYGDLNAYAASIQNSLSSNGNVYVMVVSVSKADLELVEKGELQSPEYEYGYYSGKLVTPLTTKRTQDKAALEISDAIQNRGMNAGEALNSGLKLAIDATDSEMNPPIDETSKKLLSYGWPIVVISLVSIALIVFIIVKYVKERKAWIEDEPETDPRLA